jgi:YgiT-type zinc finger domain-containing protein
MLRCDVCKSTKLEKKYIQKVFYIGGNPVFIENIPAMVCQQCGETTFDIDTAENIRKMLQGKATPVRTVNVDVFAYG